VGWSRSGSTAWLLTPVPQGISMTDDSTAFAWLRGNREISVDPNSWRPPVCSAASSLKAAAASWARAARTLSSSRCSAGSAADEPVLGRRSGSV